MAKPGVSSRLMTQGGRSLATRQALVDAAVETLKSEGFSGASARAIAGRAGCNQALVFYHFGSVVDLLLAALDEVSATRFERYRQVVADAVTPAELVGAAAAIFREDLDAGHVTVLAEMIAGASSTPGLAAALTERIAPWKAFAAEILSRVAGPALSAVVPADEAAHGIVALYLGLEMLAHLDGDRRTALALFERARGLSPLLSLAYARYESPPLGEEHT